MTKIVCKSCGCGRERHYWEGAAQHCECEGCTAWVPQMAGWEPKLNIQARPNRRIRFENEQWMPWIKKKTRFPTVEVPEAEVLKLLGINAPILSVTVSKRKRLMRFTFLPQYMWPKCETCGSPFFPTHEGETKKARRCSRNCTRRARYAVKKEQSA